ncbi:hypothetical protein ACFL17_05265 [Pseudomonadota bacterium]
MKTGSSWQIHEVKMSTGVNDVHFDDVAIQSYVLENCGLEVGETFLVHVDNSYVRSGALEVNQLFSIVDVSNEVQIRQEKLSALDHYLKISVFEITNRCEMVNK